MAWKTWFDTRKKDPKKDLTQLVEGLREALAGNLKSALVYGSFASGEYIPERSDVNVFLILKDASLQALQSFTPVLRPWLHKGHAMPVLVQEDELAFFARALPIEFFDMSEHHRVLYGEDPFEKLTLSSEALRFQCEHELSLKELKIRQALALSQGKNRLIRNLLIETVPSIYTLFRAVLRLDQKTSRMTKLEASQILARKLGLDVAELKTIHDLRVRRKTDNMEDLARHFLQAITMVLRHLTKGDG